MIRSLCAVFLAAGVFLAPAVQAQTSDQALGHIQSSNIFEVKPDASTLPGYQEQSNAERNRVQPGNNAPFWREVNSGKPGYSSLPKSQAPEAGVLIQPFVQYPGSRYTTAGEAWRQVRNDWIIPYGGSLILIVLVAIALFYFAKGSIGLKGTETGRKIERFTYFERAAHWINAVAFCVLALSGIVMAFGKFFMLPWMGGPVFGWLTWVLKTVHNFVGPLFVVSLLVVFFTFVKDNLPRAYDLIWFKKGGGLLTGEHVPSHRFNGGEKLIFWLAVTLLGFTVAASGVYLDRIIPGLSYLRGNMQVAHMIHAVAAVFMMCAILGHIYLGTLGMRGAYKAMKTGYVDETWAKEHHEYWYNDIVEGKIPAQRSGVKADTHSKPVKA